MNVQPFNATAKAVGLLVTSSASASAALPNSGSVLRVVNYGTDVAFLSVGTAAQTAVIADGTARATSTPILGGTDVVFSIAGDSVLNYSLVSPTSANVVLQVGEGA